MLLMDTKIQRVSMPAPDLTLVENDLMLKFTEEGT